MEPHQVKKRSESIIRSLGGETLDWLPVVEISGLRNPDDVANRALVMSAMIQLVFEAPLSVIKNWIIENQLNAALSHWDRRILEAPESGLSDQDRVNLYWYIEALWALTWSGGLIPDLEIHQPVGDNLAQLMPNIQTNENSSGFQNRFQLRPETDIQAMLDLYYRAHWYAREGSLKGFSTGVFNLDIIVERRKALEWISDTHVEDWDDVDLST